MDGMPEEIIDDSGQPIASYATPATQAAYVAGMRRLAATREVGTPARVYLSARPGIRHLDQWPAIRKRIARQLPGAHLLAFEDAFDGTPEYENGWEGFAAGLDGLVLVSQWGSAKKQSRMYRLGPFARTELKTLVAARKPVLLSTVGGLVPVIDCKPFTGDGSTGLRLRVPPAWTPDAETLQAALAALASPQGPVPAPARPVPAVTFAAPATG